MLFDMAEKYVNLCQEFLLFDDLEKLYFQKGVNMSVQKIVPLI